MTAATTTRRKVKKKKTKRKELPVGIGERETVVPFEETFKWPGAHKLLTFDGPQFQEWIYKTLPVSRSLVPMSMSEASKDGIKLDDFVFYALPFLMYYWGSRWGGMGGFFMPSVTDRVPLRHTLEVYRGKVQGNCCFNTPIDIPVLAKPDPFSHGRLEPWMSLTPNEILTQRGQIRRAKKNTAMAGLGLGWAARKVLERKQVTHLTVYEKSQAIIDYFGASLVADYPDKVTLVCADAYEVDWLQHDVALWDIWDSWGGASWDRKFEQIKAAMLKDNRVCVGWGEGVSN